LLSVLLISQGVGLVGMLIVAVVLGGDPGVSDLGYGAIGGLAGAAGVAMLYRGLAAGAMSLDAPITGVVAVVVPVVVGVGGGERPAALQYTGILLAVFAGATFGLFFILFHAASHAGFAAFVSGRLGSSVSAVAAGLISGAAVVARRDAWRIIVFAGLVDGCGVMLYLFASHGGLLSITAVLAAPCGLACAGSVVPGLDQAVTAVLLTLGGLAFTLLALHHPITTASAEQPFFERWA